MKQNRIKKVMREGGLAIVSHVGFADPAVIEIIAMAGFDGAFIDMEHSVFDMETVGEMIRVADLCGITPVVRVPDENPKTILRVLDMGAQGVQIPHIAGVEGAKKAVEAVRYPPVGDRGGAGSTRAAGYGTVPWTEHMKTSNEEILLIVMTEDVASLDAIADIAAVPGIDIIALGPTDISTALGMTDPADPKLRETFVELAAKVKAVGNAKVYIPVNHAACRFTPQDLLDMGVNYCSVAPAPPSIVLNALKTTAKNIRDEVAKAVKV
ncbi:MAG: aldolase/citrate lyase family protein [Chloroflexi bacterium]|nr:aldolase/citrate lyase family protein [Chloroflexota bacterium]MDA1271872.1 aldolase/citrate lyase family protein [Chloroflexota bacterium]